MIRPSVMPTSPSTMRTKGSRGGIVLAKGGLMASATARNRGCKGSQLQGKVSATGPSPSISSERSRAARTAPATAPTEIFARSKWQQSTGRLRKGSASGAGYENGVTADLHRKLRGADDRGADAVAGIDHRAGNLAIGDRIGEI